MEQHSAQNRVESLHKTHLLVVAHAQFISREVTKKIIEATELQRYAGQSIEVPIRPLPDCFP